ncbi:MAG: polyprenyl synthetase family protein [Bradymonadaceae bacterium]|nr:polyprenyl synthetase family protein [Lujinxingiaceae bacterium]
MYAAARVENELMGFERRLQDALDSFPLNREPRILQEAARHLCLLGSAKRVRPRVVFAVAQALGLAEEHAMEIAVAAELVHAASLVHDDVVDQGAMRRGRPTVNARWNNMVAVLSGDAMLCMALIQLRSFGRDLTEAAIEVVADMTRASMWEVEARGQLGLSEEQWRAMAEGKTGALFGWCGWAVACAAGHSEHAAQFDACGRHLGVAFQLADDLRDIFDTRSGKDRFADIANQNPSYVVLRAAREDAALAGAIARLWDSEQCPLDEVASIGHRVAASDAARAASVALDRECQAAIAALGTYARKPGGTEIVEFALALVAGVRAMIEDKP